MNNRGDRADYIHRRRNVVGADDAGSLADCQGRQSQSAREYPATTQIGIEPHSDHNGRHSENQLIVLERLGIFRFPAADFVKDCRQRAARWLPLFPKRISTAVSDTLNKLEARCRETQREISMLPKRPSEYRKLPNPYASQEKLEARARSYLHANCAHCHVSAGGGNALFDVEFTTELNKMNAVGIKPQHHTFSISDAKLIDPGHPERSVMLHRLAHRTAGQMPPLASSIVDEEAVRVIGDWIRHLPPLTEKPK